MKMVIPRKAWLRGWSDAAAGNRKQGDARNSAAGRAFGSQAWAWHPIRRCLTEPAGNRSPGAHWFSPGYRHPALCGEGRAGSSSDLRSQGEPWSVESSTARGGEASPEVMRTVPRACGPLQDTEARLASVKRRCRKNVNI